MTHRERLMQWLLGYRKPDPSTAGRALGELAHLAYRQRVRARARMMRAEMGLPEDRALDG